MSRAERLVDEVLDHAALRARPPVLVDIGASGAIHGGWRRLASRSICIGFDADARDFGDGHAKAHPYRKLHLEQAIVTASAEPELDFYLTRSPHCSSTLPPRPDRLAAWLFADLFDVERKVRLKARTLPAVLAEQGLGYVDWFKTDSQGTDLRLFLSLGEAIVGKVLHASFEPGLIDAYAGEDKLHAILAEMESRPFWIHDLDVRGSKRLARPLWERLRARTGGAAPLTLKDAPGWVEIAYLNTLEPADRFDLRDHLLLWALATLAGQHGFSLEVAERARDRFADPLLARLVAASEAAIVGPLDRLLPSIGKRGIDALRVVGGRILRR